MALSLTLDPAESQGYAYAVSTTGGIPNPETLIDAALAEAEAFVVTTTGGLRTVLLDIAGSKASAFDVKVERASFQTKDIPQPLSSTLGCGTWTAYLTRRGGEPKLLDIAFNSITVNRVLDNAGSCSITIPIAASSKAACAEVLSSVEPWRDEVIVSRTDEVACIGPGVT
jgi:hypothetical protein